MAIEERHVQIVNKYGLHARPAMRFVETANQYNSKVEVANGTLVVDAKSIMAIMRLGATMGTVLHITADGEDAKEAADELMELVADGFGMMDEGQNVPSL